MLSSSYAIDTYEEKKKQKPPEDYINPLEAESVPEGWGLAPRMRRKIVYIYIKVACNYNRANYVLYNNKQCIFHVEGKTLIVITY